MRKLAFYFIVTCSIVRAQTTSQNANASTPNVPVNTNCGFGKNAYNANPLAPGQLNTATGYGALYWNVTGDENTANGKEALHNNTYGSYNVAVGYRSLYNNGNASGTGGSENTAVGATAQQYNTDGSGNTSVGSESLLRNVVGSYNLAIGNEALKGTKYLNIFCSSTPGDNNTAVGSGALKSNFEGVFNTAFGKDALRDHWYGGKNSAFGFEALSTFQLSSACGKDDNIAIGSYAQGSNYAGFENVAIGSSALIDNQYGFGNTAVGLDALHMNQQGNYNTAIGWQAGASNTTSHFNTAVGINALLNNFGGFNTAVGPAAIVNSNGNNITAVGWKANVFTGSFDDNTYFGAEADLGADKTGAASIGYKAITSADNEVTLGDGNITDIYTENLFSVSDGRFKENLREEDVKGLEFILKLRPVTYQFDTKKLTDHKIRNLRQSPMYPLPNEDEESRYEQATRKRRCGLIAQEVEEAAKAVNYEFNAVHHPDSEVDSYGIDYGRLVVPLVKAVQEQQHRIEELEKTDERLSEKIYRETVFQQVLALEKVGRVKVSEGLAGKSEFFLEAVPNPFLDETKIMYFIPHSVAEARLAIADLEGRILMQRLITERGESFSVVNSVNLKPGMYVCTIVCDHKVLGSKRLLLETK